MLKVMVFIDGTWLYRSIPSLRSELRDPTFAIDYGKLPYVLARRLGQQLGISDVDVVRTHFFASYPVNCDPQDAAVVERQLDFHSMLREEYHYETELFPIDFKGRRLRWYDREPGDNFSPREKCVDLALASAIMFYAALPYAYDAAVVVVGDQDYVPVLQSVRRLGKRVMVASVRGCCDAAYTELEDSRRIRDADTVFLNDVLSEIRLQYEPQRLECQSAYHRGDRWVWTTYRRRKGTVFYCDECRDRYAQERARAFNEATAGIPQGVAQAVNSGYVAGRITRVFYEKGYGFLRAATGVDYFFHASVVQGKEFKELTEGEYVQVVPGGEPPPGKTAGNVRELRPLAAPSGPATPSEPLEEPLTSLEERV